MSFWDDPSTLRPKQQHRWVITFGQNIDSSNLSSYQPTGSIIPPHFIKSVDRPNYEIGIHQAKYLYAHTFNFPKRLVWKPITISFNDVQDRNGANTENLISLKSEKYFQGGDSSQMQEKLSIQGAYRSTQLIFYKFLQQFGYFDPNELHAADEQLLRFRSYHFKRNITKTLSGQDVNILDNNFSGKPEDHTTDYYNDYFSIHELDDEGSVIETWKIYNPILSDLKTDKLDYSNTNILTINATIAYDWAELVPVDIKKFSNFIFNFKRENAEISPYLTDTFYRLRPSESTENIPQSPTTKNKQTNNYDISTDVVTDYKGEPVKYTSETGMPLYLSKEQLSEKPNFPNTTYTPRDPKPEEPSIVERRLIQILNSK